MYPIKVSAAAYILHCSLLVFVGSKEIFFELENSEMNEVIFIGERNVVMRCGGTSLTPTDVRIEHNGINVNATSTGNNITYTIVKVVQNDDGKYTCTANFTLRNGTSVSERTYLVLNVQAITPYCFHNGTVNRECQCQCVNDGTANGEEDPIQLTCYSLIDGNCLLVSNNTIPMETCVHNYSKAVSRVIVPPTTSISLPGTPQKGGDCLFGINASDGCYFTFINDPPNRFTLKPRLPSLPSLPSWGCKDSTTMLSVATGPTPDTSVTTITSENTKPDTPVDKKTIPSDLKPTPPPPNGGIAVVVACGIAILVLVCVSIYMCIRRSKKDKHGINEDVNLDENYNKQAKIVRWLRRPTTQRLTSASSTRDLVKAPEQTEL